MQIEGYENKYSESIHVGCYTLCEKHFISLTLKNSLSAILKQKGSLKITILKIIIKKDIIFYQFIVAALIIYLIYECFYYDE